MSTHQIGKTFPRWAVVEPSRHAVQRLRSRWPQFKNLNDANARSAIIVAVRDGRLLNRKDQVRLRQFSPGLRVWIDRLNAFAVIRFSGIIATVITIYAADEKA